MSPEVESEAVDINDAGQVVGSISVFERLPDGLLLGTYRAVVWDSTTGTSVTTSESFGSATAQSINERGQVAGGLNQGPDGARVFSWMPGSDPVVLPASSPSIDSMRFLNDRGQISFLTFNDEGPGVLKIWRPDLGTTRELGPVGELESLAGMNGWPRIIGNSLEGFPDTQPNAFIWRGNVGERVDFPGWANSVNDRGLIAGQLHDRATVWSSGLRPKTIKTPGKFSSAELINDKGQVAGTWRQEKGGDSTAFFWDPATGKTTSFGKNLVPVAMNDKGRVVLQPIGTGDDITADSVPLVWDRATGKVSELPRGDRSGVGWKAFSVAINNNGQISATLQNVLQGTAGETRAVVWTRQR